MAWHDRTDIGGGDSRFQTTHWADIVSACTANEARRRQALGQIVSRYWRPIYCYLRRRGYGNEEAKDLTQGFFHEAILKRDLLQWASPVKGRFRTLLLSAVGRYCANVARDQMARKRHPASGLVHLDAATAQQLTAANPGADPEQAFHYAWASQLLDEVLRAVEAQHSAKRQMAHWHVFRERVLDPILHGAEQPSLPALCRRYRVPDKTKVSNMVVTVKRRFRKEMARRIREVVGSDADVGQEILDLIEILSEGSARSPVES
jgi:DNA-directed RNA polymerase specialized sigma24 family protein